MKGIVFTEFLEMVACNYSSEMVDDIIDATKLETDGAYTSVGTYDHNELIKLVSALSDETGISVPESIKFFGKHLFVRFSKGYPQFFQGVNSAFEFLLHVDDTVHHEVKKLYPDADLPSFTCESVSAEQLIMSYRSSHPFGDLAEGLILGCLDYFDESLSVRREDVNENPNETHVRFILIQR